MSAGRELPGGAITPALLRDWSLPEPGSSKHTRGHALVIGGAASTPGAVLLAGIAALRVGAGVLAMAVPTPIAIPLAVAVPEAGVCPLDIGAYGELDGPSRERLQGRLEQADAVVVGPGIDDGDVALALVRAVVEFGADDLPVVLDAFALGSLPHLGAPAKQLAGRLVLTPNHAEAARLLEREVNESGDDVQTAVDVADRWDAVVSFQGVVAAPGTHPRPGSTGDSGLGTSGSGDVLAGAVVGLLARGATVDQAACWASYLHAAAGDRLAARIGRLGYLARELLDEIPLTLAELGA